MDIKALVKSLEGCPCGREHISDIKAVEIGSGLVDHVGEILEQNEFPKKILIVADHNTLNAAAGIVESLDRNGYMYYFHLYGDLRVAEMSQVEIIAGMAKDFEGILSIGTGSLNDICRRAALVADREFAIFATAPSMDGFASGTSPIINSNNFKITYPARQPSIIIADTKILAAAPAFLKSAGYGDLIGKYTGLVDWKISHLLTGEYYCDNIAELTRTALRRITALSGKVTSEDEETAGAIMETLVFTGIAMKLADSVRPASGTEHVLSHFWEIKKLEQGLLSDFHGKKVGVATLLCTRVYKELAKNKSVSAHEEIIDWKNIHDVYGDNFINDVIKVNTPPVTSETTPERINECWSEICRIVNEELPSPEDLERMMKAAGAATTIEEIAVSNELYELGMVFHPYMRHRMTLMRLIPMLV